MVSMYFTKYCKFTYDKYNGRLIQVTIFEKKTGCTSGSNLYEVHVGLLGTAKQVVC